MYSRFCTLMLTVSMLLNTVAADNSSYCGPGNTAVCVTSDFYPYTNVCRASDEVNHYYSPSCWRVFSSPSSKLTSLRVAVKTTMPGPAPRTTLMWVLKSKLSLARQWLLIRMECCYYDIDAVSVGTDTLFSGINACGSNPDCTGPLIAATLNYASGNRSGLFFVSLSVTGLLPRTAGPGAASTFTPTVRTWTAYASATATSTRSAFQTAYTAAAPIPGGKAEYPSCAVSIPNRSLPAARRWHCRSRQPTAFWLQVIFANLIMVISHPGHLSHNVCANKPVSYWSLALSPLAQYKKLSLT